MARPPLPAQGDPAPWGTPLNTHVLALGTELDTANTKLDALTKEVEVVAAGTAYTLTGTMAAVAFGTTSPIISVPTVGTWLATCILTVNFVGATYALTTDSTLEVKLRNTTTSTDLGQVWKFPLPVGSTTKTAPAGSFSFPVRWVQATATQNVQLFARLVTLPSAGSCTVTAAQITAKRAY